MAQLDGVADHAAPKLKTVGWSPKALGATIAAFVAAVLVPAAADLVELVIGQPELFAGLPGWVQVGISALLTALAALLAAHRASPGDVVPDSRPEAAESI